MTLIEQTHTLVNDNICISSGTHLLKRNTTVTCNAISAGVATQVQNHSAWSIFPHKQIFAFIYFSTYKYIFPGPGTQNRPEWIPGMFLPFLPKYSSPQKWIYSQHNRHVQNYFRRWMQHGRRTWNRHEWIPNILKNTPWGYKVMLFHRQFQIILHSNILEYGTLRIYDRPCFWHQKSEKSECFGNISKSTSTLTIIWKFLL